MAEETKEIKQPEPEKKKGHRSNALFLLLFLVGLGISVYPILSQYVYYQKSTEIVEEFELDRKNMDNVEIQERLRLAHAYNASVGNTNLHDPYTEQEKLAGRAEYPRMLELRERIGHVKVPRINEDIPLYAGTSEEVLQKGLGHLEGTSLPVGGTSTHSILTGHRGLPSAKLFTDLDKMEIGDQFYIYNLAGVLAYEIDDIQVIEPTNFEPLLITAGADQVTLLTCTPYMINSHRLIVRGHSVPYSEEREKEEEKKHRGITREMILILLIAAIVLGLILLAFAMRPKI